jgi:hypothetical protein
MARLSQTIRGRNALRPAGAIAETMNRNGLSASSLAALVSGRITFTGLYLYVDEVITTITFFSSTTPLAAGTNQWFVLIDSTGVPLRFTVDDGANAWAANSEKTLALTSPYRITADGVYLVGCMVAAGTVPTIAGATGHAALLGKAPQLSVRDNTHLTLTTVASAPNPFTLDVVMSTHMFAFVS